MITKQKRIKEIEKIFNKDEKDCVGLAKAVNDWSSDQIGQEIAEMEKEEKYIKIDKINKEYKIMKTYESKTFFINKLAIKLLEEEYDIDIVTELDKVDEKQDFLDSNGKLFSIEIKIFNKEISDYIFDLENGE